MSQGIWQEHVTPGSSLEKAMLQATDLMRERCEPPRSFLVSGTVMPVALFHPLFSTRKTVAK